MKPDICIYHSKCADGFTAAWAVWKRWGDDVEYFPGVYGEAAPDVTGKRVLMVDFSYKRPVLEEMSGQAVDITILDHHKTAQADLETFAILNPVSADDIDEVLESTQPGLGNIRAEFDMNRSGAMMAWHFCHPFNIAPRLVQHVQDRDLWRFELPGTRAIQASVFAHAYDFGTWNWLAEICEVDGGRERLIAEGEAIERKHFKDIAELLSICTREMVIGGHRVKVANLPYTMSSDAANALADGAPFGACYFDRGDGQRVFSLRSKPDGLDVAEIAASYGGGGHARASGFQVPIGWEGDPSHA